MADATRSDAANSITTRSYRVWLTNTETQSEARSIEAVSAMEAVRLLPNVDYSKEYSALDSDGELWRVGFCVGLYRNPQ